MELKDRVNVGDIIFIAIDNFLYRRVSAFTNSWTSHVGFVYEKSEDGIIVAESTVPWSKKTKLEDFLRRSKSGKFSIKRLKKPLHTEECIKLKVATDKRLNKLYHTGFKYYSKRTFCSKFIYDIYREALNVSIGELESFNDLLAKNPDTKKSFWRTWYFGVIPYERVTVTPASQYESPLLDTVIEE